jgi:small subunit ribosomal protein S1
MSEEIKKNDLSLAWDNCQTWMESGEALTVKVDSVVKGGVVAFVEGIRGFIPASKLTNSYVEKLEDFVGKEIEVQVITCEKAEKRLVLSGKELAQKKAAEAKKALKEQFKVGATVEGTVESIMPYGAFIRLADGVSGLVHISQISDKRVKAVEDVLAVGDAVTAKIINTEKGKISLSIKALLVPEEVVVVEKEPVFNYKEEGKASTNLGDLLKGLKF